MPAEDSPYSGTTRVLSVVVTPERADDVAEALRELVGRTPTHPGILPIVAAGVAEGRPFLVIPDVQGEPLDVALRLYGPAALADALPRLQQLAEALDVAAAAGMTHGALTPADIIVSAEETWVTGLGVVAALANVGVRYPTTPPYAAPERIADQPAIRADVSSLAVIAREWLGSRSLIPDPSIADFPSCSAFVAAIAESVTGSGTATARVLDFVAPTIDDELPLQATIDPSPEFSVSTMDGLPASNAVLPRTDTRRFGAMAMSAALVAGVVVGGLAVWAIASRWSATSPLEETAVVDASPDVAVRDEQVVDPPREVTEAVINPPIDEPPPAVRQIASTVEATPAQLDAGLLVHSIPAGAFVSIDGISRGTTPLAVRGLALGRRTVSISRPGYRSVERQVVLTDTRPSRALEVELAPVRAEAPPPGPVSGLLVIDSRPSGAVVFIDDREAGRTPTMVTVPAGAHRIRLERAGYRPVTMQVDVKAGARSRVAARLEGGTDEE